MENKPGSWAVMSDKLQKREVYIDDLLCNEKSMESESSKHSQIVQMLVKQSVIDLSKLEGYKTKFTYAKKVPNKFEDVRAEGKTDNYQKPSDSLNETVEFLEKIGVIEKIG